MKVPWKIAGGSMNRKCDKEVKPMRITRISVDGLFGMFNHDIGMKLDDRITIIHGMNGYGKTTILRMVNALFNKRYSDLRTTPFKEFRVDLEDGSTVSVTKLDGDRATTGKRRRSHGIHVRLLKKGKEVEKADFASPVPENMDTHFAVPPFEQFISGIVREGRHTWRYVPTDEELTYEDVIDRFADQMPPGFFKTEKPNVEWLHHLQKSVKVRFIESQRLLRLSKGNIHRRAHEYESSPALELSVAVHANDLAKAIQSKLTEYATLSQSLDRTFPGRLVEHMQSATVDPTDSIAQLREKLTNLEEKRNRLQDAGLLDKQEDLRFQVPEELQEPTQRVLPVYVTDVEKKLGVFDNIAAKIDLLKDIVNSRFSYKKISIDKEKGFVFRTDGGQPLNPSHLSSGEQHMLVLFSELLFRVESNSLVMIDEPEISLHVTWQKQFLRDLQQVTELASFDVLIATHSPQIVHDRWDDLTVELQGIATEQSV
jgi:predicted ATP-dependent endonuclease of OLD family